MLFPECRCSTAKPNRGLWFGWNSTGQILFMIQSYQRFCWRPGCSPSILAKYSYFWGGNADTIFFFLLLLPWSSDTLQINDSAWHLEIEVCKAAFAVGFHADFIGLFLTCKYINCLGHKQLRKTHLFLYCTQEAMLNGRDTWEEPLLDCLDFSRSSGKFQIGWSMGTLQYHAFLVIFVLTTFHFPQMNSEKLKENVSP